MTPTDFIPRNAEYLLHFNNDTYPHKFLFFFNTTTTVIISFTENRILNSSGPNTSLKVLHTGAVEGRRLQLRTSCCQILRIIMTKGESAKPLSAERCWTRDLRAWVQYFSTVTQVSNVFLISEEVPTFYFLTAAVPFIDFKCVQLWKLISLY